MKNILFLFLLLSATSCSQSLDASYEGEELILVERMPINISDKGWRQFIYPNTIPLGSIYWNSNNNQYYYVKDGTLLTKTNNLTYKLDPVKQQESSFIGEPQDTQLVYAGYISSNQRLYINPKTKEQFIKILEPIIDDEELVPTFRKISDTDWAITYWWIIDEIGNSRLPSNGKWEGMEGNFR